MFPVSEVERVGADRGEFAAGPDGKGAAEPGGQSAVGPSGLVAAATQKSCLSGLFTAPGWVRDDDGRLKRETKPRMGRRLPGFDYSQRRIYEITIVLEERRPILGRLVKREGSALLGRGPDWATFNSAGDGLVDSMVWVVEPSVFGDAVLACWQEIAARWPQIELIECQLMPDHFHGILFVKEQLPLTRPGECEGPRNRRKKLGDVIQGFKAGCSIAWRELVGNSPEFDRGPDQGPEVASRASGNRRAPAAMAAGVPRWAEGFVDTILFGKGQLARMVAYLRDNPRCLGVKRERPELFKVTRSLEVALKSPSIAPWSAPATGRFSAIGNHFLLARPAFHQVQVSRRFFAYSRDARGHLMKDAPPAVLTPEFTEKLDAALAAAKHGAVIVSPCISQGEREIARRAFAAGYRVITLANQGFSPLYKPGGRLFETCAAGNLLMLAPVGWPYQPAEKPMTRVDALVLNRLAQLIAGDGAVEIDYKGVTIADVDEAVGKVI